MNFARDVVDAAPPARRALVAISREGDRREWTMGEIAAASARAAGALAARGVRRGDVVLTLVGNRPEWVIAMVACFRLGAIALPCTEQLRPADLRHRLDVAAPRLVVCDERNAGTLATAAPDAHVVLVPGPELMAAPPAAGTADLEPDDPCLLTFTSGTSGPPKAVLHGQRYLAGQTLQARHWLGAPEHGLVWCTAATGWSKSARNAFVAPWLLGAAALLHDARFDPHERLDIAARDEVTTLCMAPTEYRAIAARGDPAAAARRLRGLVAAGEPLDAATLAAWHEATGLWIRDGYGQTETGQLTGTPPGETPRPGSMGRPLPGVRLDVSDGELVLDPGTAPTFFLGYLGEPAPEGPWRTGDRVRAGDDGHLYFEGRADDLILSAGYRIGPTEVEAALTTHPAVAEAAVVAAPDPQRGSVVRAVVVLAHDTAASPELAKALQEHVKAQTAPYKYPRIVEFANDLPRTATGKVRRAALRDAPPGPSAPRRSG